jgi:hypothetical protein
LYNGENQKGRIIINNRPRILRDHSTKPESTNRAAIISPVPGSIAASQDG